MTQRRIYQTEYPYFITTVTAGRSPVFEDKEKAALMAEIIHESCAMHEYTSIAFCILPDHLHLLVESKSESAESWTRAMSPQQERAQRALEKARCLEILNPQRGLSSPRCGADSRCGVDHTVSCLMQSIKGTFSRAAHRGRIWQPRFNSRIVDSERRLENTVRYTTFNYQKHDLPGPYGKEPYVFAANLTPVPRTARFRC